MGSFPQRTARSNQQFDCEAFRTFQVSVAEVENEDVHQIASIGIAFTCSERGYALRMMEQLECFVEDETDAMVLQKETELLDF